MARYVLLEFSDNKEADLFTVAIGQAGGVFFSSDSGTGVGAYGYIDPTKVRARAVFAKPTGFCECPTLSDNSSRGKKWGWYVCVKCKKPREGQWQHPRNLLDPIDIPTTQRQLYLGVIEPELPPGTKLGPYTQRKR
jgi:hypothetical protein